MRSTSSSAPPERGRPRRGPLLAVAVVVVLVVAAVTAFAVSSSGNGDSGSAKPPATGDSGHQSFVRTFVDTATTAQLGKPAPDFTLRTLDGGTVSLSSLEGRPVIVNFWASWCNPCRHEFPQLRQTIQKYKADRLAVVGISFQDIDDDARAFAKKQHATWPLAVDLGNGVAAKTYGVRSVPTTFFITPDGVIADQVFGQLPTGRDFQTSLSKILQAHALGT